MRSRIGLGALRVVNMDSPRLGSEVEVDYRRAEQEGVSVRSVWESLTSKIKGIGLLFWLVVVFPTAVALFYFGLFASDVYLSESRFVVRSPDKPATTGLGMLLKSTGFGNGGDEILVAQDFVVSRDALKALNSNGAYARAYANGNISIFDRFQAFGSGGTFEDLYKYYQNKVKIDHDTTSSITTLTVRAYTPNDAERFNEQLLEMAEATVNKLNTRGRQDLIRFAEAEVAEAKKTARDAALSLSAYRNREGVLDPEKQASVQLQMISKLQDELIASRTHLAELRHFTPQNPQIEVLQTRINETSHEIDMQLGKVAGNSTSLSSSAAGYQRLALESQFADRQLAAAMASLEEATNEARRKQAYVERIVQPNIPDKALEPRRWRGIFATLALGLVAWGILSMLLTGVREHRD
jgi:capsular polysaccharide transport system permease protein